MRTLLIVECGVLGLVVGSFLNVVVYRVPRHQSLLRPRSRCTSCEQRIRDRDNIPVLSWILLKGRCRNCQARISPRYPLVEFTTGALFVGSAAQLGVNWALPADLFFLASVFALALIDFEHLVLPRTIIYTALVGVSAFLLLAAAIYGEWHRFLLAVICAASWFALFFVINLLSPRSLGFGDVRLAPLLGLVLGWLGIRYVLLGFFLSNLIGALIGIGLIATKRIDRNHPVPYGVFLAMGSTLTLFAGTDLLRPFQHIL